MKEKERKVIAERFSLIESYFMVLDHEYYDEAEIVALTRIIEEMRHLAHVVYGVDGGEWEKYFLFKYDLNSYDGRFSAEESLREDYKQILNNFKGGN